MGRPNKALMVSDGDRTQLNAMVRSHSMPHALVRRARIVLLSGQGQSNREVARRCGVSAPPSAIGAAVIRSAGWPDCTTNLDQGVPALATMKRWRN
jgi:hypothetical protein